MQIEEIPAGASITFLITISGEHLTFDSKIQAVYPKKHLVLADPVYHKDKVISFHGPKMIVNILVSFDDEKPQLFKNVTVTTMKKADGSLCYNLSTRAESKPYNRRENFRCFIGIPTVMQCGANHSTHDIVIRDVSMTGFSVACDSEVELNSNQVIHVVLNDYIAELAENFSFQLYGIVVRIQELDNGKIIYGCRTNSRVIGLESYIMKKERIRLQKSNYRLQT